MLLIWKDDSTSRRPRAKYSTTDNWLIGELPWHVLMDFPAVQTLGTWFNWQQMLSVNGGYFMSSEKQFVDCICQFYRSAGGCYCWNISRREAEAACLKRHFESFTAVYTSPCQMFISFATNSALLHWVLYLGFYLDRMFLTFDGNKHISPSSVMLIWETTSNIGWQKKPKASIIWVISERGHYCGRRKEANEIASVLT